jgi:hypothetical protein
VGFQAAGRTDCRNEIVEGHGDRDGDPYRQSGKLEGCSGGSRRVDGVIEAVRMRMDTIIVSRGRRVFRAAQRRPSRGY